MSKQLTLGSLFSGSGGFELAGQLEGIKPIWNSEIAPFPIRVTTKRFPNVKHYGDISDMDGGKVEPVDVITFGSPCQDLSLAGRREGLDGSRSSLFFEAVRVIKEMRCATNDKYPRWIVWENVPGAFSSNGGEDFRQVLEEICKVKDENISVPKPDGRWTAAGEILGDDFSVAYRVLDAQYHGVPQRRKRIFLVADFGGRTAGKILFEQEGVPGNSSQNLCERESSAACAEESTGAASGIVLNDQGGNRLDVSENIASTLRAQTHGHLPCVMSAGFCTEHSAKSRNIGYEEENSPTLRAGVVPAVVSDNPIAFNQRQEGMTVSENLANTLTQTDYKGTQVIAREVYENHSQDTRYTGPLDVAQTVSATYGKGGNNQPFVVEGTPCFDVRFTSDGTKNSRGNIYQTETSRTLDTGGNSPDSNQGGVAVIERTAYGISSFSSNAMLSDNPNSGIYEADTSRTLDANGGNPSCNQGGIAVVEGNGSRPSHHGDGYKESDVMYTLNTVDRHAVAYALDRAAYNQGKNAKFNISINEDGTAQTVVAKGPGAVSAEPKYTVRRLTPLECCRLQGFPDFWCDDLGTENPTDAEIDYWSGVFETYNKALGKSTKAASRNRIIKWLENPYSDSAMYAMWGNGVALPCVRFVLAGIAAVQS